MGGKLIYTLTRRTQRTLRRKDLILLCGLAPFALKYNYPYFLKAPLIAEDNTQTTLIFPYSKIENKGIREGG